MERFIAEEQSNKLTAVESMHVLHKSLVGSNLRLQAQTPL